MPKPIIRNINDLINWLSNNAPMPSIARALEEGSYRNRGYFKEIPGSKHPGWIIEVKSRFGELWNVVVVYDCNTFDYRSFVLNTCVARCVYVGGETELYKGE